MFLVGVLIFAIATGFSISLWSEPYVFCDIYSLVFLIVANASIIIATHSAEDLVYGLRLLVLRDSKVDVEKLVNSIKLFTLLKKTSGVTGLVGFLIGAIGVLSKYEKLSTVELTSGIIVALTIIFYCAVLELAIILPAEHTLMKIESNINSKSSNSKVKKYLG